MRKYVRQGGVAPKGYRLAWIDYLRNRAVAYPVGIHVLAWAVRRLWEASWGRLPESYQSYITGRNEQLCRENAELRDECMRLEEELDGYKKAMTHRIFTMAEESRE